MAADEMDRRGACGVIRPGRLAGAVTERLPQGGMRIGSDVGCLA